MCECVHSVTQRQMSLLAHRSCQESSSPVGGGGWGRVGGLLMASVSFITIIPASLSAK